MKKDVYNNLVLPRALTLAIQEKRWPRGPVPTTVLRVFPWLDDTEVDFEQKFDGMQPFWRLFEFEEEARLADFYKVFRGSSTKEPRDMSWIDVEKAVYIGGALDMGDDLRILLDYRTSEENPRVVANEFLSESELGPTELIWREVSPGFEAFCEKTGIAEGRIKQKSWLSRLIHG